MAAPHPIGVDNVMLADMTGQISKRVNQFALVLGLVLPWLLFVGIFASVSFKIHYWYPSISWLIVAVGGILVLVTGTFTFFLWYKTDRDPWWMIFLFATMLIALVTGAWLGNKNFYYYMSPYYETAALNTYYNLNPYSVKGQEIVDAGQITFTSGVQVDDDKSMGFKSREMFCVAPIGRKSHNGTSQRHDVWAVGLNCCTGSSGSFGCYQGQAERMSGVRVAGGWEKPFYDLAVKQAAAKYKLEVSHAILVKLVSDASTGLADYAMDGQRYFVIGIFTSLVVQLVFVGIFSIRAMFQLENPQEKVPLAKF